MRGGANNAGPNCKAQKSAIAAARRHSRMFFSRVLPINLSTDDTDNNPSLSAGTSLPSASQKDSKAGELSGAAVGEDGSLQPSSTEVAESTKDPSLNDEADVENTGVASKIAHQASRSVSSNERILELRGPGKHAWMPSAGQLDGSLGASLIVRRLQKTKERQSAEAQKQSEHGLRELQQTFISRQVIHDSSSWEFWASVIGSYDVVARTQPDRLKRAIQEGFPEELRGLLWQVIASSKSLALEQLYTELVEVEDPPCNAIIEKDLDRTPMAKRVSRDALARLLRAYSLFDPEVGYTQGMAFVVVPLLQELSEPEAFSLFVQLMKTYDFRSMFLAGMPGLHLKLYQFDRLIEDVLEPVHIHLRRQGVQSSMYASQWFLTMFAYRFPPSLVTRIFDITIAEGLEALLRFSFSLIEASARKILSLEGLDHLLPYLKEQIFDQFTGKENELVKLASNLELYPQVLSKFELEHCELNRLEKERNDQMEVLRTTNAYLSLQNKNLESTLEALNSEHVQVVNKMIEKRLEMVHLKDENLELKHRLLKIHDSSSAHTKVTSKLEKLNSELVHEKHENEALQKELTLLRQASELESTVSLLKELERLKEVNLRYEGQLSSLQESLAGALDAHH